MTTLTLLSGCASVSGDKAQRILVETVDQDGTMVDGARCSLRNNYGVTEGESGTQIMTRKSSENLQIECKKDGYADARGDAISRANSGMWGNVFLGGAVGAIVDHNQGLAYNYPEWIRLVFGKVLTFDRRGDKYGQPTVAEGVQEGKQEAADLASMR